MQRREALKSVVAALAAATPAATRQAPPLDGRPPYIETRDRTRLFYRDSGTGVPIVFVAPWALCADWWEYQIASMTRRGFRCIAYDRRGHGRSDEPNRGYDFDTIAADLASVIEQLDLRNVVLVGHSMGAAEVVRYLARQTAGRVTRALLVAPIRPFTLKTADNPDGVALDVLDQARERLAKDRPGQIAAAAAGFFGAPQNQVSAETVAWWTRTLVDRCSLRVMLELHRAMTETDFRSDLAAITVPTLIVHGDRDVSAPLELAGRPTHRLIRSSELRIYEGAAHGLPATHGDRLRDDLHAFASQTPR
jgi:non-heme chloroperoxidase